VGVERDLAMFNLAIDSKLRGCDVVSLKVEDVAPRVCRRSVPAIATVLAMIADAFPEPVPQRRCPARESEAISLEQNQSALIKLAHYRLPDWLLETFYFVLFLRPGRRFGLWVQPRLSHRRNKGSASIPVAALIGSGLKR
jgi:hypothetical protein